MKAVITAAGLGTRSGLDGKLRKEMLPVYDRRGGELVLRPMIDCIMHRLENAGINGFVVVVDPEDKYTKEYIENEFDEVDFAYQREKKGFGDAVLKARPYVNGEPFILNAGDGMILPQEHIDMVVKTAVENRDRNVLTLFRVPNPQRYGTARVDRDGGRYRVTEVVEKSTTPPSSLALTAFYAFTRGILDFIDDRESNVELTPAINRMILSGTYTIGIEIDRPNWVSVGIAKEYADILRRTLRLVE
ncbi:hypothetical protein IX51_05635 [uncultured archaeon]|nr:hypothetical protein IX51_05635 [uncultured archaeon]